MSNSALQTLSAFLCRLLGCSFTSSGFAVLWCYGWLRPWVLPWLMARDPHLSPFVSFIVFTQRSSEGQPTFMSSFLFSLFQAGAGEATGTRSVTETIVDCSFLSISTRWLSVLRSHMRVHTSSREIHLCKDTWPFSKNVNTTNWILDRFNHWPFFKEMSTSGIVFHTHLHFSRRVWDFKSVLSSIRNNVY